MNAGIVEDDLDPRSATVRERRLSLVPSGPSLIGVGFAEGLGMDTAPDGRLPDFENTAVRRMVLPDPTDPADDFPAWLDCVRESDDPEQGLLSLRARRGDLAVVGGALLTLARTSGKRGAGWETRVFAIASVALLFARDAEDLLRAICRTARDRLAEVPGLPEPEEHFALHALTALRTQADFEPNEVFNSYIARVEDAEKAPQPRRALMRAASDFCRTFETLERLEQNPILLNLIETESGKGMPTLPDTALPRAVISVDSANRMPPLIPVDEPSVLVSQSMATDAVNLGPDGQHRPLSIAPRPAPPTPQPAVQPAPVRVVSIVPPSPPAPAPVPPDPWASAIAAAQAPVGAPVRAVPSEDPWAALIAAAQVPSLAPAPVAPPAAAPLIFPPAPVRARPVTPARPVAAVQPLPAAPPERAADPWAQAMASVQAQPVAPPPPQAQPAPETARHSESGTWGLAGLGGLGDWPAEDGETTSLVDERFTVGPGGGLPTGVAVAAMAAACGAVCLAVLAAKLGSAFAVVAGLWAIAGIGLFADRRPTWLLGVVGFAITGGFLLVQSARVEVEWMSPAVLALTGVASMVSAGLLLHPSLVRRYRSSSAWLRTR